MSIEKKKILIIDEARFSRVCSAILEKEGYGTRTVSDVRLIEPTMDYSDLGLVIMSYPFGAELLEDLRIMKIPTIILSDRLNRDLVMELENFDKSLSYCMIKPLDYTKFRNLVRQIMHCDDSGIEQAHIGKVIQTEIQMKMQAEQ